MYLECGKRGGVKAELKIYIRGATRRKRATVLSGEGDSGGDRKVVRLRVTVCSSSLSIKVNLRLTWELHFRQTTVLTREELLPM